MTEAALDSATVESLLESTGGDREFVAELFETYLAEATGLMDGIIAAQAAQDFAALRAAAHTLKSTSASLGALTLSRSCRELEEAGRVGVAPPGDLVAMAKAQLAAAQSEMARFIAEGSGA